MNYIYKIIRFLFTLPLFLASFMLIFDIVLKLLGKTMLLFI